MDVEGFEGFVLDGATRLLQRRLIKNIVLEFTTLMIAGTGWPPKDRKDPAKAAAASAAAGDAGQKAGTEAVAPSRQHRTRAMLRGLSEDASANLTPPQVAGLAMLDMLKSWGYSLSSEGFNGPFMDDGEIRAAGIGPYQKPNIYATLRD